MEELRSVIDKNIFTLPGEIVSVHDSSGRIAARDIYAKHDMPFYDESLRDGYVVPCGGERSDGGDCVFPVAGEIAAGTQAIDRLLVGTSCRIYTGGLIPEDGCRVVPFEKCSEVDGVVRIAQEDLQSDRLFIRKKGTEIRGGEILVRKGACLCLDHLMLLVSAGVTELQVSVRPRVVCFCTGNELLKEGEPLTKGRKVSTNSLLLQHMIPRYGGRVDECSILQDDSMLLDNMFAGLRMKQVDVVISTGGMGPGKYDLVRDAFCAAGGKVLLSSLAMRPGKSILLGKLGDIYFIALPGPPHAVRTLLSEFVGPVLFRLQGASVCWPESFQASLEHSFRIKHRKGVQVKSGVLSVVKGRCLVRVTKRLETALCNICFAAGGEEYKKGDLVEVHRWHVEQ